MRVIKSKPLTPQSCNNCGRAPVFLAQYDTPSGNAVCLCADCLNDGETQIRNAYRTIPPRDLRITDEK